MNTGLINEIKGDFMPQTEFYREEYRINPIPYDPLADKLQLHSVFHSYWRAGYVSEKIRAKHAIYSITKTGSSRRVSAKQELVYRKGCFSWARSRKPNLREAAEGGEDLVRKSVQVYQTAFHEALSSLFFETTEGTIPLTDPERVEKIFDELYGEMGRELPDESRLAGLFYQLLHEVTRQRSKRNIPPVLEKVLEFISVKLADPELSRPAIAEACGISERTLSRLFRKELGITVTEHICNTRLSRVCGLLTLSGLRIKEIALQCGFRSAGFMADRFRKRYGQSPGEFRESAVPVKGR